METAEVKTKKRIRHCYPRKEVYHRWIHSPELVYSAGDSYRCFGIGNYFGTGIVDNKFTLEKFHDLEYYNLNRLLAIINRNKKEIIIYTGYKYYPYELFSAVPDNYTIFYTDEKIPSLDILNNREELYKLHAKHLVSNFIGHYSQFYQVLDNKCKTLHSDIDKWLEPDEEGYRESKIGPNYYIGKHEIIYFAKKYKLGKYKWYNESLGKTTAWNGWNNKTDIIYPSLRKIVNNKIFTEKELTYLRQRYFYTKFCYGEGIPFSDVEKYWNKEMTHDELVRYSSKRFYFNNDWLVDIYNWNDWIIKCVEAGRKAKYNYEQECNAKARENYRKAEEELNKLKNDSWNVNDWREGKRLPKASVDYRDYCKGEWYTRTLSLNSQYKFPNVQFKLVNNEILTSRNVTIKYEEGVRLFKIFLGIIRDRDKYTKFKFDNQNIKVNIYNLKLIEYKSKHTDIGFNKDLGYYTWLIQVGCHNIWLDDILDFIHYYNKEQDFSITKETTIKDFEI